MSPCELVLHKLMSIADHEHTLLCSLIFIAVGAMENFLYLLIS